ncbi:aspartyl-phosphate phosphatase Spo0E family protein [Domibacillus indicus]|uniref:aspartyl-phosphate phosphatase Spo0E family protein n=1 Tax=Domibacillus indicus TaxID=1437523 RepID=UPI002041127C|nr:aspartyl-phosphate phosphatase Spo0E family protein [Domibacillus indicus]MCM3789316.1 aspartyl-phosphate phosphatase Spo0E family protein [Domibacillus indicus]
METLEVTYNDLHSQIEELRSLMIDAATLHGISSLDTLRYSEELDKLIMQAQLQNP